MIVRYVPSSVGWKDYVAYLKALASRPTVARVLEVGGGANPALSLDFIRSTGISYTVLDVSHEQLEKAPSGYEQIVADITAETVEVQQEYDLVFSSMVAEHIKDPALFHRNILRWLAPNGRALHFFSTLYAPPFVVNRLLPEPISERLLQLLVSRREPSGSHGKFRAYYRWCRGPTRRQITRFEALGYRVEEYVGLFGHAGYYEKLKALKTVHEALVSFLLNYPVPLVTSYAYVVLSRAPSGNTSR